MTLRKGGTWPLFRPSEYEDSVQALGKRVAGELGLEFIGAPIWKGDNLEFVGCFRYKGRTREEVLATRKALEEDNFRAAENAAKTRLLNWKRQIDEPR